MEARGKVGRPRVQSTLLRIVRGLVRRGRTRPRRSSPSLQRARRDCSRQTRSLDGPATQRWCFDTSGRWYGRPPSCKTSQDNMTSTTTVDVVRVRPSRHPPEQTTKEKAPRTTRHAAHVSKRIHLCIQGMSRRSERSETQRVLERCLVDA